jgi:murein DD-endopeptidase MepM/ murein hydrolase activator NlpD
MKAGAAVISILSAAAAVLICGCPSPKWNLISEEELVAEGEGVFHTVKKGETLYKISKAYGVDLQTIAEENDLEDVSKLKTGDRLYIPGARKVVEIPVALAQPVPEKPAKPVQPPKQPSHPAKPPSQPSKPAQPVQVAVKDEEVPAMYKGKFIWPVKEGVVVSRFGIRGGTKHQGIDISAPKGSPVLAARAGKVIYSDNKLRGYGNLILIRHDDGFISVYAHNKENKAREGDTVDRGQVIALLGATGNAEAPHLHFEIREGSKARNPLFFLP